MEELLGMVWYWRPESLACYGNLLHTTAWPTPERTCRILCFLCCKSCLRAVFAQPPHFWQFWGVFDTQLLRRKQKKNWSAQMETLNVPAVRYSVGIYHDDVLICPIILKWAESESFSCVRNGRFSRPDWPKPQGTCPDPTAAPAPSQRPGLMNSWGPSDPHNPAIL